MASLTHGVLFNHCPFLLPQGEDVEKILDEWKEYKMGVPTYGAIILDETLENVSESNTEFLSEMVISCFHPNVTCIVF